MANTSNPIETDELLTFFSGIPHWVADAGLSPEGAEAVAEHMEAFVEILLDAGYPPVDVDGPEPDSFPQPSNRIAAAANQAQGLLRGLDRAGWDTEIGEESVTAHARSTRARLRELATNPD